MDLAAEDPDFLNRFMKEGQLAGQLNHKNIVRIYDAGMEGNRAFIAMEFIEGCDTLELLENRGALPAEEVLALAIGIAEALQEAHSLGIVHRDIKPDNILATNEGRIKLADLGLAKQVNDDFGSTMAGTALGTPYYISPEQALDAMKADARSDIYSLGATLYHLLSGFLPYEGDNVMGVMLRHANEELIPPIEKNPNIPKSFSRVICKMMEKHPDNRYQSCTELLDDLFKMKYGNENVAQNSDDLAEQSEKMLSQQLTSSKSVRVRMKIPNKGKYAHKEGIVTRRDIKKRTGVRPKAASKSNAKNHKKQKNIVAPIIAGVAVFILLIALVPSLLKKEAEPGSNIVGSNSNNEQKISKESEDKPTRNTEVKTEPVSIKKAPDIKPTSNVNRINLLEDEGKRYFRLSRPETVEFINGNMILKGESEKNDKLLISKNSYSNYKIEIEFKWLAKDSDTGIDIHVEKGKPFYEVNIANSLAPSGSLYGKGKEAKMTHNGQEYKVFKVKEKLAAEINQWYSMEVICQKNTLSLFIDGRHIYDVEGLASESGRIRGNLWKKVHIEIRKFDLIPLD